MFRPRIRSRSAAALLGAMVLLTAACGGTGSEAGADQDIATLSDVDRQEAPNEATPEEVGGTDGDDVEAPEDFEDAIALFDECMADAGFEFETVEMGGEDGAAVESLDEGALSAEGDPQAGGGSFEDFDADAFEDANTICEAHMANVDGGFDLDPEQQAAFEDAQLEWAQCMADQGVDVPEMDASGSGMIAIEGPVEVDPQSGGFVDDPGFDFQAFEDAEKACRHVYEQYDELDGLFDEADQ